LTPKFSSDYLPEPENWNILSPIRRQIMKTKYPGQNWFSLSRVALFAAFFLICAGESYAQGGAQVLFGDVNINEGNVTGVKPQTFYVILYTTLGHVIGRQAVGNNGRYRFLDVPNGEYDLVVEVENQETARIHFRIQEFTKTDVRRDIALEWKENKSLPVKNSTVMALDDYQRPPASQPLFTRALDDIKQNKADEGIAILQQIVKNDAKDFVAWTELATALYKKGKLEEAEKSYLSALEGKPTYIVALMNLGKLRFGQKNYEGAIEIFTRATESQPQSADANLYLGESFLQIKKGSKAVGYLNRAIELDPLGKAEVHLRLATLYNGAGMKDRAATEYEKFLEKKPDYADKKKLQQYITDNKK
jgi:tetratricopeptide (TPR) repeat protein